MELPEDKVAFRVELQMPRGPSLAREWTWGDVERGDYPRWPFDGEPHWLLEPTIQWRDPMLPVVFYGRVPAGAAEDFARDLLFGNIV